MSNHKHIILHALFIMHLYPILGACENDAQRRSDDTDPAVYPCSPEHVSPVWNPQSSISSSSSQTCTKPEVEKLTDILKRYPVPPSIDAFERLNKEYKDFLADPLSIDAFERTYKDSLDQYKVFLEERIPFLEGKIAIKSNLSHNELRDQLAGLIHEDFFNVDKYFYRCDYRFHYINIKQVVGRVIWPEDLPEEFDKSGQTLLYSVKKSINVEELQSDIIETLTLLCDQIKDDGYKSRIKLRKHLTQTCVPRFKFSRNKNYPNITKISIKFALRQEDHTINVAYLDKDGHLVLKTFKGRGANDYTKDGHLVLKTGSGYNDYTCKSKEPLSSSKNSVEEAVGGTTECLTHQELRYPVSYLPHNHNYSQYHDSTPSSSSIRFPPGLSIRCPPGLNHPSALIERILRIHAL